MRSVCQFFWTHITLFVTKPRLVPTLRSRRCTVNVLRPGHFRGDTWSTSGQFTPITVRVTFRQPSYPTLSHLHRDSCLSHVVHQVVLTRDFYRPRDDGRKSDPYLRDPQVPKVSSSPPRLQSGLYSPTPVSHTSDPTRWYRVEGTY